MIASMRNAYQRALALRSKGGPVAATGSTTIAYNQRPQLRSAHAPAWLVQQPQAAAVAAAPARSPEANLGRIRVVFGPSMTELAELLSVSRQALYGWQGGGNISEDNAAKLDDLAVAADAIAASGVVSVPAMLRRKVPRVGSISDAIKAGKSAVEVAQKLAELLVAEARQRQRLEARLKGRAAAPSPESAFPPALDERSE